MTSLEACTTSRAFSINHCKDMSLPTHKTHAWISLHYSSAVLSLYTATPYTSHYKLTQSHNAPDILSLLPHKGGHVSIALVLISSQTGQVKKDVCVAERYREEGARKRGKSRSTSETGWFRCSYIIVCVNIWGIHLLLYSDFKFKIV